MPQMAPLNWLTLMIYFIVIVTLINSLNFYAFTNNCTHKKNHLKFNSYINWKWL